MVIISKGSNQQYKQFNINTTEDACLVLGTLISGVVANLNKYKEYTVELEVLSASLEDEYVSAKTYDDINDKLLFRQREILKLIADYQKDSFSYINLHNRLKKDSYLSSELSQEVSELLKDFLYIRNWSLHNPQSMLVAAQEVANKSIPEELKGIAKVDLQLNPVLIPNIIKYETVKIVTLYSHAEKRVSQFEKILESMKNDYQEMFDSLENKPLLTTQQGLSQKVQYIEIDTISRITDQRDDIAQISMAIQKSKYDGSNESFRDWAISPWIDEENK